MSPLLLGEVGSTTSFNESNGLTRAGEETVTTGLSASISVTVVNM